MTRSVQMRSLGGFSLLALSLSGAGGMLAVLAARVVPDLAPLLLVGMVAVVPVIAFGLARFHTLVFLAIASSSLVRREPAPIDLMVPLLLVLGILTGRLSLKGVERSSLIHACLGLFIAINLISLLVAHDLTYASRYLAITLYLIGLAYFVMFYVTSAERMRLVLSGYLTAALISVAMVGGELLGLIPTREFFVRESRAVAFFKDANVFAPFLVLPIVFLVDELLRPHLFPGRFWLKIGAILSLSAGVFLAFSRAAWANLAVSLVVYLMLSAPALSLRQWARLLLPALTGVTVLAGLIIQLNLVSFLLWRARPLQTYDTDRFGIQAEGIEAGLSHLFGIGPGMLSNAHSLYVRTFAEYGIFGLITLLVVILVPLYYCLRCACSDTDRVYGLSARVVSASMIGLLLNSVVIDTIHWRSFWIMASLCWIAAMVHVSRKRNQG